MKSWKHTVLGPHIDLLSGYAFKSDLYSSCDDDVKLLRGDNVIQGQLRWEGVQRWPRSEANGLSRYDLADGDIVLAMDRTWVNAGLKCARVATDDLPCLLVQRVARLRGESDLATDFLYHTLQTHRFVQYVKGVQTETAIPHISSQQIREYPLHLPPLPEQQKIAAILSTWDRAIELTEKLIAAKQKRKQALMQQLLTGKVRLSGFEKTIWKKCHLGDVAMNSSRRNGNSTDQPTVYSVTNSVGMIPMEEGVIGESIDRYKTVSRFDFAYNPMRINVGSISMWEGDEDVLVSPDYVVFRCGSKLDAEFLNHFRRTHYWRHFVTRAGGGSVRVRIYFSDLASMKLKLPSVEEQRSIAAVLNAQDEEIGLLDRRRDALKQQKKGLMQQLLTGKVRVRT